MHPYIHPSAPGNNSYRVFVEVMGDKLEAEEKKHVCCETELKYNDEYKEDDYI